MGKISKIKFFLKKSIYFNSMFMFLICCMLLLAGGLGQVTRWDLLEQISMADNYIKTGNFYPSPDDPLPHGVSVYFPGNAFLGHLLFSIGIDFYLVESMIIISCIVIILFMGIQRNILINVFDLRCTWDVFIPFATAFTVILAPVWLFYAREFKPDTIAYFFGLFGLSLASYLRVDSKWYSIVLGSFIVSLGTLFKQQYIAFVIGVSFFCVFNPSRTRMFFLVGLILFSLGFLGIIYSIDNLWFWNFTVLSDDGFISFKQFILDSCPTAIALIFAYFIYKLIHNKHIGIGDKFSLPHKKNEMGGTVYCSPWLWAVLPSTIVAFASAFKVGGNSGNIQLGLVLLLPLFFAVFYRMRRIIIFGLAWMAIISALPTLYSGPKRYMEAVHLRDFVFFDSKANLNINLVLTGSDVYFASRAYRKHSKIVNYWSVALAKNNAELNATLKNMLVNMSPERLILENWPDNKELIRSDGRYEILFENDSCIIAGLISNYEN